MTMTRKDYVKVAEILNAQMTEIDENVFATMVDKFCDLFHSDNPNFSPARFEVACFGE
jgi:ABC-type lipoprotein release transport system permease subunit